MEREQVDSKERRRLVIFGCGYVGEAVAQRALAQGWQVEALVRRPERAEALRQQGIAALASRLVEGDWTAQIAPGADAVVVAISAGGGGAEGYRAAYVAGLARVRAWAARARVGTLVYTSSTGVYPQGGGLRIDEAAPVHPPGGGTTGSALVEAEAEVVRGVAEGAWERGVVLRLAGIYGPGRHYLLDQLRQGQTEFAGSGDLHLNLIHRDDAAGAIWACLGNSIPGIDVFNVADGHPARKAEVVGWLAQQLGLPAPVFRAEAAGPRAAARGGPMPDRIIVADRLRAATGWEPRFPDYRAGYRAILGMSLEPV